jgi:hypothetical protein
MTIGRQDITKILLKVALSTMALTLLSSNIWGSCYSIFSLICKLCRTLFGLLYFFLWPLCCLFFFDIWILIAPLVSSNSSFHNIRYIYNYPISTFIMTTFFSNYIIWTCCIVMSYIQFSFYGDFSVSISWQSLFLLFNTNLWQPVLINIMCHAIVSHILFFPFAPLRNIRCNARL